MPPSVPRTTGRLDNRVRRVPCQRVVVDGRHAGRREAQQEAVESEVVESPAQQGEAVVFVVAAFAVAAVEVSQRQRVARCLRERCSRDLAGLLTAPETNHPDRQREHREQPNTAPNICTSRLCGNTA